MYVLPSLRMWTSCEAVWRRRGSGNTEIQSVKDIGNPNSNEVLIFVEGKGQDELALQASREKVLGALNATYGVFGIQQARFQFPRRPPRSQPSWSY